MRHLIIIALLLTACAPHPNLPIRLGMNQEQVKQAWGLPCYSCHGTMQTSHGEVWQYDRYLGRTLGHRYKHVFFNRSGQVVGWSR